MTLQDWGIVVGIGVFSALSAFFALSETALLSLRRWQFQEIAASSPKLSNRLMQMLEAPSDVVTVTTLWNTIANASLTFLVLWTPIIKEWNVLNWTIGAFIYILVVCEVGPKTFAIGSPVEWALRVARPMSWIFQRSLPLCRRLRVSVTRRLSRFIPNAVQANSHVTTGDVQEILELGYKHGALTQTERDMLREIVDLHQGVAGDIMIPRSLLPGVQFGATNEELVRAAKRAKQRRVILWGREPDQVDGFLNARTLLLFGADHIDDAIEVASMVPDSMNLFELFVRLLKQKRGIAIVIDEFGAPKGAITLELILESVIHGFHTEKKFHDPGFQRAGPNRWRARGDVRIEAFRQEQPNFPDSEEVETLAGLILLKNQEIPKAGESFTLGPYTLKVIDADVRHIRALHVECANK